MDINKTSLLEGLKQILTQIRMSRVCLSDLIYDGGKTNENVEIFVKRYKFWREAGIIIEVCAEEIEEAYKRIGEP